MPPETLVREFEQPQDVSFHEQNLQTVVEIHGIRGTVQDLMESGLCPMDLDQMPAEEMDRFTAKIMVDSGYELNEEHKHLVEPLPKDADKAKQVEEKPEVPKKEPLIEKTVKIETVTPPITVERPTVLQRVVELPKKLEERAVESIKAVFTKEADDRPQLIEREAQQVALEEQHIHDLIDEIESRKPEHELVTVEKPPVVASFVVAQEVAPPVFMIPTPEKPVALEPTIFVPIIHKPESLATIPEVMLPAPVSADAESLDVSIEWETTLEDIRELPELQPAQPNVDIVPEAWQESLAELQNLPVIVESTAHGPQPLRAPETGDAFFANQYQEIDGAALDPEIIGDLPITSEHIERALPLVAKISEEAHLSTVQAEQVETFVTTLPKPVQESLARFMVPTAEAPVAEQEVREVQEQTIMIAVVADRLHELSMTGQAESVEAEKIKEILVVQYRSLCNRISAPVDEESIKAFIAMVESEDYSFSVIDAAKSGYDPMRERQRQDLGLLRPSDNGFLAALTTMAQLVVKRTITFNQ